METNFSFTKPLLDSIPFADSRVIYKDTHKQAYGLQLRVSKTAKTFFIRKKINGVSERFTIGPFPDWTIMNAREEAARLVGLVAQGINPNSDARARREEITLGQLFDDFLKNRLNRRGARLAAKTQRNYKYDFESYLSKWETWPLSKLQDTDFGKLHTTIGQTKPVQANRVIALCSSLYSYAKEKKLYSGDNPAAGIKFFAENKRDRFMQSDELPKFFEALMFEPNTAFRDYFLVSLMTGVRQSNVLAMAWKDVHLVRAEWRIPITKNGDPQTITLSPEVVEILQNRQGCDPIWVFPSKNSKSGHIQEPKKNWANLLKRAGLENLRMHDLRRTLGSWQAKAGASLVIIGKSLNHKSHSTTAIYARLDTDPVRESVNTAVSNMLVAGGIKPAAEVVPIKKVK